MIFIISFVNYIHKIVLTNHGFHRFGCLSLVVLIVIFDAVYKYIEIRLFREESLVSKWDVQIYAFLF